MDFTVTDCIYCKRSVNDCPPTSPAFSCNQCSLPIHPKCLKKGPIPGALLGDPFYTIVCTKCCQYEVETISRTKLSWLEVTLITLYNMAHDKNIPSRNGYFHYKNQIAVYVKDKWNILFPPNVNVSKNWPVSVSSVLSSFSPMLFASGARELREPGWWKLARLAPPVELLAVKREAQTKNKPAARLPISHYPGTRRKNKEKQDITVAESPMDSEDSMSSASVWTPAPSVMDDDDSSETSVSTSTISSKVRAKDEWLTAEGLKVSETLPEHLFGDNDSPVDYEIEVDDGFAVQEELALDVGNFQPKVKIEQGAADSNSTSDPPVVETQVWERQKIKEEKETDNNEEKEEKEQTKKAKRRKKDEDSKAVKLVPMGVFEEQVLLRRLDMLNQLGKLNGDGVRLRRKLIVRKQCRTSGRPVFDFDGLVSKLKGNPVEHSNACQINRPFEQRVLDRFYGGVHHALEYQRKSTSFRIKLIGGESTPQAFISPYTGRKLKPFIRRDYECKPPKAKILDAIRERGLQKGLLESAPSAIPLDYCYVQPQHIAAVNALCREFFWPGIDLCEVLQYPDFSCVVMYRKVVVAFAFMVPDVSYNEAYISFIFTHPDWRGAGIAKFMLYHLIQTGMGKDITLHVSATNQALIMYQRFGFKVEEFLTDFYDKYLPVDSTLCKHALFMRLCR